MIEGKRWKEYMKGCDNNHTHTGCTNTLSFWALNRWKNESEDLRYTVVCKTCIVFFEFAESPIKIFKKCKIRTRFAESTPLPPQCFICSIFNAWYVVYSVLRMWSIQCFICSIFSASYATYSVPLMWPTQCFIYGLPSASYVVYSELHT